MESSVNAVNMAVAAIFALLALAQVWTTWNTVRHYAQSFRNLMELHQDTVRRLWIMEASKEPERAAIMGQLDQMTRPRASEPELRRANAGMAWEDDEVLNR